MLYRQVQNTHLCIFGCIHIETIPELVYAVQWYKDFWGWVQPHSIALRWKRSVLMLWVPRSHCLQGVADPLWVSSPAERIVFHSGWWSKAVVRAACTYGLAVHRGQRIYLQGNCCCWSLDRASLQAPQSLGRCVCLWYTSSPVRVLPRGLGCSHSSFPCSNNMVPVTASQLDFNLPAKGCIFI